MTNSIETIVKGINQDEILLAHLKGKPYAPSEVENGINTIKKLINAVAESDEEEYEFFVEEDALELLAKFDDLDKKAGNAIDDFIDNYLLNEVAEVVKLLWDRIREGAVKIDYESRRKIAQIEENITAKAIEVIGDDVQRSWWEIEEYSPDCYTINVFQQHHQGDVREWETFCRTGTPEQVARDFSDWVYQVADDSRGDGYNRIVNNYDDDMNELDFKEEDGKFFVRLKPGSDAKWKTNWIEHGERETPIEAFMKYREAA